MKRLLLALLAAGLMAAQNSTRHHQRRQGTPIPVIRLPRRYGATETHAYRDWTTAQLQQRRLELYGMTPLAQSREGVPAYIYHGQAQPSQDESKAIEVELNWRYQHGDKTAELKEFWPSSRRHLATSSLRDTIF